MSPVLVVHEGKRDNYELAAGLAGIGLSVHLVTTGYGFSWVRWWSKLIPIRLLRKLADRKCRFVPDENVHALLYSELAAKVMRRIVGEARAEEWLNNRISAKALAVRAKIGSFDAIYCYNYNAFKIFNACGNSQLKVLFQCHPHPVSIKSEFERLEALSLVSTKNSEKEFSYSDEYLAMLIAEPVLADSVLCASSFTKRSLMENGVPERKITVVPYGVEFGYSAPRSSAKSDKLRVIFVGQFVERKGLRIIEKVLDKAALPLEMIFVGRGNVDVDVEALFSQKPYTVKVLRDISNSQLSDLYASTDVFLFPSVIEGFAHVILEAMFHGCVPVVSANTCASDVIDHGRSGFIFSPDDVHGYAGALGSLIEPGYREELSKAAKDRAAEFTWQRFRGSIGNYALEQGRLWQSSLA